MTTSPEEPQQALATMQRELVMGFVTVCEQQLDVARAAGLPTSAVIATFAATLRGLAWTYRDYLVSVIKGADDHKLVARELDLRIDEVAKGIRNAGPQALAAAERNERAAAAAAAAQGAANE